MRAYTSPFINEDSNTISFYIDNDCAKKVSLTGSFNNWARNVLLLQHENNGLWHIDIPMLRGGRYQYKFLIDDKMWVEDIDNPYKEPDGQIGFNSVLII
jgi:1,4-alpha-glucan branching enzyme